MKLAAWICPWTCAHGESSTPVPTWHNWTPRHRIGPHHNSERQIVSARASGSISKLVQGAGIHANGALLSTFSGCGHRMTTRRCLIYCRVSTYEQEDNASLPSLQPNWSNLSYTPKSMTRIKGIDIANPQSAYSTHDTPSERMQRMAARSGQRDRTHGSHHHIRRFPDTSLLTIPGNGGSDDL